MSATPAPVLLKPADAAARLGVTPRLLERLRHNGGGPVFVQLSPRRLAYEISALDAWVAANRHTSVAAARAAEKAAG